jgi:hypothetical protein
MGKKKEKKRQQKAANLPSKPSSHNNNDRAGSQAGLFPSELEHNRPLGALDENAEFSTRTLPSAIGISTLDNIEIAPHLLPQTPPIYRTDGKLQNAYYEQELARLQEETVKLQYWVAEKGLRVVIVFEGRSGAGKGGVIKRITERTNPRIVRVIALPKPSDRERTQWWFQRYVASLPAAGEMVMMDRSWYNRASGRTGHGLLHRRRIPRISPLLSPVRANVGPFGHHFAQILVLGQRRGTGKTFPGAGGNTL